jgi:hypothetical protein
MAQSNSQMIDGQGKVILVLDQSDFSALNALLFEVREDEEKLRSIAQVNGMGLGANHVESLAELWNTLHNVPLGR